MQQFYEHIERDPAAPEGVRVVEFLKIAYSKGGPDLAIYRPLDTSMFVYQKGGWDYRPLLDFYARYQLITDSNRIAELQTIVDEIY